MGIESARIGDTVAVVDPKTGRQLYGTVTGVSASGRTRYIHVQGVRIPVGIIRGEGMIDPLPQPEPKAEIYTLAQPPEPTGQAIITRQVPPKPEPEEKVIEKQIPLGGVAPPVFVPPEPKPVVVTRPTGEVVMPTPSPIIAPSLVAPELTAVKKLEPLDIEEQVITARLEKGAEIAEKIEIVPEKEFKVIAGETIIPKARKAPIVPTISETDIIAPLALEQKLPSAKVTPFTDIEKFELSLRQMEAKETQPILKGFEQIGLGAVGLATGIAGAVAEFPKKPVETIVEVAKGIVLFPLLVAEKAIKGRPFEAAGEALAGVLIGKGIGKGISVAKPVLPKVTGVKPMFQVTEVAELRRVVEVGKAQKPLFGEIIGKIKEPTITIKEPTFKTVLTGKEIIGLTKKPFKKAKFDIETDVLGRTAITTLARERIVPFGKGRVKLVTERPKLPELVDVEVTQLITGKKVTGLGLPKPITLKETKVTAEALRFLKPPKEFLPKVAVTKLPKAKRTPLIFEPLKPPKGKLPKDILKVPKGAERPLVVLKAPKIKARKRYVPIEIKELRPSLRPFKFPTAPIGVRPRKPPITKFPKPIKFPVGTDLFGKLGRPRLKVPKGLERRVDITRQVIKPKAMVKPVEIFDIGFKPVTRPKAIVKPKIAPPTIRPVLKPITRPILKPIEIFKPVTKPRQRVTPLLRQTTGFDFGDPFRPIRPTKIRRPPPPPPFFLFPKERVFKPPKDIFGMGVKPKVTTKYRPSLIGIVFDIRGKKPKRLTGLEVRPISRKRRKRKKGLGILRF